MTVIKFILIYSFLVNGTPVEFEAPRPYDTLADCRAKAAAIAELVYSAECFDVAYTLRPVA